MRNLLKIRDTFIMNKIVNLATFVPHVERTVVRKQISQFKNKQFNQNQTKSNQILFYNRLANMITINHLQFKQYQNQAYKQSKELVQHAANVINFMYQLQNVCQQIQTVKGLIQLKTNTTSILSYQQKADDMVQEMIKQALIKYSNLYKNLDQNWKEKVYQQIGIQAQFLYTQIADKAKDQQFEGFQKQIFFK